MPFIPTEEQIESLYSLLKQLRRERIEIRLIRFIKWLGNNIKHHEIEINCLEEEDRYIIYFNGEVKQKYRNK